MRVKPDMFPIFCPCAYVSSPSHARLAMTDFYSGISRRQDDITKDLVLLAVDGTSIKVHSKVIRRKWAHPGKALLPNVSELPQIQTGLRPVLLNLVVDYCYNVAINPQEHSFTIMEQLLDSADSAGVQGLADRIMDALVAKISVDNCLTLWKLCKRYDSPHSFKVHDFVLYNLIGHINTSLDLLYDWYRLSAGEVAFILADDYLHVRNEEDVWYLACVWMRVDRTSRAEYALRFARLLRFQDQSELLSLIARDSFGLFPQDISNEMRVGVLKPRYPRDLIAVFGGRRRVLARHLASTDVEVYDKRNRVWHKAPFISGILSNSHTMVSLGSDVYLMEERLISNSFRMIKGPKSFRDKVCWTNRAPMYCENRSNAASCVLNGRIYVMGGGDGTNTVERYDPVVNQWTRMPNMQKRRNFAAAVALNGRVYVIGGSDGVQLLDSVEVFDEEMGSWTELRNPLITARKAHSAVVWNGGILVAGGLCSIPLAGLENEFMASNSVEFFNPCRNTWTACPPMDGIRFSFSMVCFEDEVLAIGGMSTYENTLNTVERFDGSGWQIDSFLREPRGQHQACLLCNWPYTEGLVKVMEPERFFLGQRTAFSVMREPPDWDSIKEIEDDGNENAVQ